MKPQYVYTVERDSDLTDYSARPIVWEQYLDQGAADLERVAARATSIGGQFGRVRIARLAYLDEDNDLMDALDKIANLYDYEMPVGQAASALYDATCIAIGALNKMRGEK